MASLPITPDVLRWAIDESGLPVEEVSAKVGTDVREWLNGARRPTLGQLRTAATLLRRPLATFFLPRPPKNDNPSVQFRHPPEVARDTLNAEERKALREAVRQQRVLSWVTEQLGHDVVALPEFDLRDEPAKVAARVRDWIGISVATQRAWSSASTAFRAWRNALESHGLLVFLFPMGSESCRGFSVWEPRAPLIAVNTAWSPEARIFSMFHELGHLVTRTSSACVEGGAKLATATGSAERWCEQFAACLLMPPDALDAVLRIEAGWSPGSKIDLGVAALIARRFRVSLRSAALRLIEARLAGWDLYRAIPPASDQKRRGGRASEPRFRATVRREQFGRRAASLFFSAVDADVLNRSDLIDYLDVSDRGLDDIQSALNRMTAEHA